MNREIAREICSVISKQLSDSTIRDFPRIITAILDKHESRLREACRLGAYIDESGYATLADALRKVAESLPGPRCGSGLAARWADWLEAKAAELDEALAEPANEPKGESNG